MRYHYTAPDCQNFKILKMSNAGEHMDNRVFILPNFKTHPPRDPDILLHIIYPGERKSHA